jgi:putative flavoprotein involved in K+ transport
MFEWLRDIGFFDERTEQVTDRAVFEQRQPLISGANGGHTISLQQLASDGVILLGRLRAVQGHRVQLARDLEPSMRFGDEISGRHRRSVDEHILRSGIDAAPPEPDPRDRPLTGVPSCPAELDLRAEGITSVIWCTGFAADVVWVPRPLRPRLGRPPSTAPGLYSVGFPWLRSRKSGLLSGVDDDAEHVARRITVRRAHARARAS